MKTGLRKDNIGLKGCVKWTVFHHNEEGLLKLKELRNLLAEGKITVDEREKKRRVILENPQYSEVKEKRLTFFDKLMNISPSFIKSIIDGTKVTGLMTGINFNIVTDEGDALVADIMSETPARTKVDNSNGYIEVGTGWTGSTPKANTSCNTPVGSPEGMDATYPKQKGSFGNANDNITQYRAVFEAGDLNSVDIDEAALLNDSVAISGDCLAYAEISPKVTVATSDTLQIDWELTYIGA